MKAKLVLDFGSLRDYLKTMLRVAGRWRSRWDELTLREGEEGTLRTLINTTNTGVGGWDPPVVDEDWYAIGHATHKGVEGAELENLYYKSVEMTKEVNVRNPSGSSGQGIKTRQ